MTDQPIGLHRGGPPESVLPPEPADVLAALDRARAEPDVESRRTQLRAIARARPTCVAAWAALGDDARDDIDAPPRVIVNQTMARQLWPNESPIGKRARVMLFNGITPEVIGVVGDVKHDEPGEKLSPAVYVPYRQIKDPIRWLMAEMTFVVRAAGRPEQLARRADGEGRRRRGRVSFQWDTHVL